MLKVKTKCLKINDLIAKKWRFFLVWLVEISKFRWILSDELGCVFKFLLKKKRTPIRQLKSKKVRFFDCSRLFWNKNPRNFDFAKNRQKMVCTCRNSEKKKVDVGPLFSTFLAKKHVTSLVFISL